MMPVKIGMNSHTRLTKNPSGSAETIASRTVAAYIATSVGMFRTNAVTISRPEERQDLHARVEPLEEAALLGDVVAEHRAAHDADGAREGLLDEAALLPLADAAAGAQRELAGDEPRRRGDVLGVCLEDVRHAVTGGLASRPRTVRFVVAEPPPPGEQPDDPDEAHEEHADEHDADERGQQVADHRMIAAVEPVAAEDGVAPEAAELVQPGRDRGQVVLREVEVLRARPRRTRRPGRAARAA